MNKHEAAVISAFTGILIGDPSDFHHYVEDKFERPVLKHEMSEQSFWDKLKKLSIDDFININYSIE